MSLTRKTQLLGITLVVLVITSTVSHLVANKLKLRTLMALVFGFFADAAGDFRPTMTA